MLKTSVSHYVHTHTYTHTHTHTHTHVGSAMHHLVIVLDVEVCST